MKKLLMLACLLLVPSVGQAAILDEYNISNGVTYREQAEDGTLPQSVRVMEMNMTDPFTRVALGAPDPLNQLIRPSAQAAQLSKDGHEVIGAINGSFFNRQPMPLYVVAIDNYLWNGGRLELSKDEFVSEPVAFGVTKDGKGHIGEYSMDFQYIHNGTEKQMDGQNGPRHLNTVMVYTPDWADGITTTNPFGYEIIVAGAGTERMQFGESLTGTVVGFRPYGTETGASIPEDGFVLSAHGTKASELQDSVKIGDTISISADVDETWQGAQFMIGSGPLLVDDGAVQLTMNPTSPKAREKAPRTAVAVDDDGGTVAFITADGRQPGYAVGMSLSEFAAYIQSLGYEQALNLDGGGSTVMLARQPGDTGLTIQNKPSDFAGERPVSTFLMAVTTAPEGKPVAITASLSHDSAMVGDTIHVTVDRIMDEYGNPLPVDDVIVTTTAGTVSGTRVTLTKAGPQTVTVTKGATSVTLPVAVAPNSEEPLFSDVPVGFRAEEAIASLVEKGVISGFPDGRFQPQATLTRVQAAIMLQRALNLPVDTAVDPGFSDVPPTYTSYGSVAAVAEAGIMLGRADGRFDLQAPLTRAEMAAVLARALKLPPAVNAYFSDNPKGTFSYESVNALAEAGITTGFPDGTFRPGEPIKRADFSLFLHRGLEGMEK